MEEAFPYRTGDDFKDMCMYLGAMTLAWAWVDNALAMTLSLIMDKFGSIDGHSEAPLSLKKKVKCLRAALKSIRELKGLQERGSLLADRLVALGGRRNNFVHGAMWKTHEGAIQTTSFKVAKGQYATHEQGVDVSDAITLEGEVAALSNDMTAFMLAVDQIPRGEHPAHA